MSTVDTDASDDGIYRTTFDPTTDSPVVEIVEAIEAAIGSAAPDQVLADSIEPDIFEQLYRTDRSGAWMFSFDHDGVEITLWAGGRIHIEPPSTASCGTKSGQPQPTGTGQSAGSSL